MAKKAEVEVKDNKVFIRAFLDRMAAATISRMAQLEDRSQSRQMGVILERVARLFREDPEKLAELGIISPFLAESKVA